ncbi:GNAT family N-acetyltransferase [Fictibacillus enclensis]|uniref:GNAT family N-acetyltransferase n=1 Tax=Fictibacillus enclensis TaxID=1017270 RepID=UPI0025A2E5BD|nr:GNAT family N-acetyltransferase [Fictibacillus enclensis]MDM5336330.1 GNAT family N-acetyltransferase [Fictibacillus enclensis]
MKIVNVQKRMDLFDRAVNTYWEQWGNQDNFVFYQDCIKHSCKTEEDLPRFYIGLVDDQIVGTVALLRNDLNSRQDLTPWLACLYVSPGYRGKGLGAQLLDHAVKETRRKEYPHLYLATDLQNYYERYGWSQHVEVYGPDGGSLKIYRMPTGQQ